MAVPFLKRAFDLRQPAVLPGVLTKLERGNDGWQAFKEIHDTPVIALRTGACALLIFAGFRWLVGKAAYSPAFLCVTALATNFVRSGEIQRVISHVRTKALTLFRRDAGEENLNLYVYLAQDEAAAATLLQGPKSLQRIKAFLKWMVEQQGCPQAVLRLMADPSYQLLTFDVLQLIFKHKPQLALYVMENHLTYPYQLSPADQLAIWAGTQNLTVMHALVKHGVPLDVRDSQHENPVEAKVADYIRTFDKTSAFAGICGFLSLNPPSNTVSLTVRLSLDKHPNIVAALAQANNWNAVDIQDEQAAIFSLKPAVDIALKENRFGLAKEVLTERAAIVAAVVAAVCSPLILLTENSYLRICLSIADVLFSVFIVYRTAYKRFEQQAHEFLGRQAIDALFNASFPPQAVTEYIGVHNDLWSKIAANRLNTLDDHGTTIWDYNDYSADLETLKPLLDAVCAQDSFNKCEAFIEVIAEGKEDLVKYILEKGTIHADQFSDEQYQKLLDNLNDKKVAAALKQGKFNIDRPLKTSDKGSMNYFHQLLNAKEPDIQKIEVMLEAGPAFDRTKVPFDRLPTPLKDKLTEYEKSLQTRKV
jgi:hypothetical protein